MSESTRALMRIALRALVSPQSAAPVGSPIAAPDEPTLVRALGCARWARTSSTPSSDPGSSYFPLPSPRFSAPPPSRRTPSRTARRGACALPHAAQRDHCVRRGVLRRGAERIVSRARRALASRHTSRRPRVLPCRAGASPARCASRRRTIRHRRRTNRPPPRERGSGVAVHERARGGVSRGRSGSDGRVGSLLPAASAAFPDGVGTRDKRKANPN
jgi:hypothetical protein